MKNASRGPGEKRKVAGYTILETMIFLTVSALLFISAMRLVGGQQGRTEFSHGVREAESVLQDASNDIADGYYSNRTSTSARLTCAVNPASPYLLTLGTSATDSQGANAGCVLVGKAIQFGPSDLNKQQIRLIPLFGRQYIDASQKKGAVQSFNDTGGSGVYPGAAGTNGIKAWSGAPDATEKKSFGAGVTAECVLYPKYTSPTFSPTSYATPCTNNATVATSMYKVDTIAFMTTFQSNDTAAGSSTVNLVIFKQTTGTGTGVGRLTSATVDELLQYKTDVTKNAHDACDPTDVFSNTCINPPGGVYICVQGTGSNQHAFIILGGNISQKSTTIDVKEGKC
jgi:hypothetical protein